MYQAGTAGLFAVINSHDRTDPSDQSDLTNKTMTKQQTLIGVIPSRWGSTRFPGKSLADICGKPLVQWVWERAKQAKILTDLVIATDDQRIVKVVEAFGGKAVMTKAGHPSGTDRIAEAIQNTDTDVVINIQGDEPLIDPELIDTLGRTLMQDVSWDMATAATLIRNEQDVTDPSVVKVVFDEHHRALYFSRSTIPYMRDHDIAEGEQVRLYWRHIGIYAYQRSFLERLVQEPPCLLEQAEKLEQLRALHLGCRLNVVEVDDVGIGVDEPGDIAKVEALLNA